MADKRPPEPVTLANATLDQMSKVEKLKAASASLRYVAGASRHAFADEVEAMGRGEAETLSGEAKEISKHFGIYQQQERIAGRKSGDYIFMVRLKVPAGGEFSPEQWEALNVACERYADRTLRITTRQGIQFHYVSAKNLGGLLRFLNQDYQTRDYEMTTLGACGDVNRNTMCGPFDDLDAELPLDSRSLAHEIAVELAPRAGSTSYYQIFLQEEAAGRLRQLTEDEPIYGAQYLPRKFKVGIAHPHDNSVDVLTQDVGLVPIGAGEQYDLYAGGGLGITHNQPQTRQLLGLHLGRVQRAQVVAATRAIALLQKEHGERKDRRQARWKYTIRRLGVDTVKRALRERFGIELRDGEPAPLAPNRFFLGWQPEHGEEQRLALGLPVLSGRLKDDGERRTRSAVREIVRRTGCGVRLTPNQDLLLCHLPADRRGEIDGLLREHGATLAADLSNVRLQALACPAIPTCGLAMTDAENSLPRYLQALEDAGLGDVDVVIRISGCPNGCSRPATAEIGIIGYGKHDHLIQVGGSREGTRIAKVLYDRVPEQEMSRVLCGIARAIREHANGLPAGEFLHRTPSEQLRAWVGFEAA